MNATAFMKTQQELAEIVPPPRPSSSSKPIVNTVKVILSNKLKQNPKMSRTNALRYIVSEIYKTTPNITIADMKTILKPLSPNFTNENNTVFGSVIGNVMNAIDYRQSKKTQPVQNLSKVVNAAPTVKSTIPTIPPVAANNE
jgi:hypothetical protein